MGATRAASAAPPWSARQLNVAKLAVESTRLKTCLHSHTIAASRADHTPATIHRKTDTAWAQWATVRPGQTRLAVPSQHACGKGHPASGCSTEPYAALGRRAVVKTVLFGASHGVPQCPRLERVSPASTRPTYPPADNSLGVAVPPHENGLRTFKQRPVTGVPRTLPPGSPDCPLLAVSGRHHRFGTTRGTRWASSTVVDT